MVVVRRDPVAREVVRSHSGLVLIRNVGVSNFVSVAQKHMNSIIVSDKLSQSVSEGVLSLLSLINPMA